MWYDTCIVLFFLPLSSERLAVFYCELGFFSRCLALPASGSPFSSHSCLAAWPLSSMSFHLCTELLGLLSGVTPERAPQKGAAAAAASSFLVFAWDPSLSRLSPSTWLLSEGSWRVSQVSGVHLGLI